MQLKNALVAKETFSYHHQHYNKEKKLINKKMDKLQRKQSFAIPTPQN